EGRSAVLNSRLDGKRGVVFVARDMTDLKQAEEDIRFRAYYDSLTHLPNRVHFLESLSDAIVRARRTEVMTALLFIDLDRFKNINDSQGHHRGDEMLKEVAKRLKRCVRSTDTVARLGGDEFTVVTPDLTNELHASKITETILEALSQPYDLFGQEIYASASIGITICPTDGDD
ncbi:MAG: GGDEF domain-containing protein, partial [Rhodocyclaceae bacterium]|nr:GGDEF domain-containing protein [Rhodocyclaceae bacterium]